MKLLLQKDYQLRGWKNDPFYLERISDRKLWPLSLESFSFLLRCDGHTEIDPEAWPKEPVLMRDMGVFAPCKEGETLELYQEYFQYPNRKCDYMEISITGRCNMNCKHCFNAKDANPRTDEVPLEKLLTLIRQMAECGVGRIRLNGGEPLVRRDLLTVTEELARQNIRIEILLTNGYALTPELVDALEAQGHHPQWFVSFDGIGHHDWLRGVRGAEEKAKKAVEMLCSRGYYVQIHQCVWRDSMESIRPTVLWANEVGAARYRVLTVEPSLRWVELAPNQTVTTEEWLEFLPGFLDWWYENKIKMSLDVWSYWMHENPDNSRVLIYPDLSSRHAGNHSPACSTNNTRPFIDADGRLVPCMPLSGITNALGPNFGNVFEGDDLRDLLTDSAYVNQVYTSCGELKSRHEKCRNCRWFEICGTGCRAEAMARTRDINGIDDRICKFFESGCYESLVEVAEKHGLVYR